MLASVHIADLGPRRALPLILKGPSAVKAPGLLHAEMGIAAPLSADLLAKPQPGRVVLVTMWNDEAALDQFVAESQVANAMANGWSARLQPLRAWGSWPAVPDDLPTTRNVESVGPVAVLTMGRVRVRRALPFVRASAKAEGRVVTAPGLIWATGTARPPFVSTFSLWESAEAAREYAFAAGAHNDAIAQGRAEPFHKREAFVRFRPYATTGHLEGRNPLSAALVATL
jgi:heme-degrading monooxygenase HmoA